MEKFQDLNTRLFILTLQKLLPQSFISMFSLSRKYAKFLNDKNFWITMINSEFSKTNLKNVQQLHGVGFETVDGNLDKLSIYELREIYGHLKYNKYMTEHDTLIDAHKQNPRILELDAKIRRANSSIAVMVGELHKLREIRNHLHKVHEHKVDRLKTGAEHFKHIFIDKSAHKNKKLTQDYVPVIIDRVQQDNLRNFLSARSEKNPGSVIGITPVELRTVLDEDNIPDYVLTEGTVVGIYWNKSKGSNPEYFLYVKKVNGNISLLYYNIKRFDQFNALLQYEYPHQTLAEIYKAYQFPFAK